MLVGLQIAIQQPAQTSSETHAFIHPESSFQQPSRPSAQSSNFHIIRPNPVHSFVSITLLLREVTAKSHWCKWVCYNLQYFPNPAHTILSLLSHLASSAPLHFDVKHKLTNKYQAINISPQASTKTCDSCYSLLSPHTDLIRNLPASLHPGKCPSHLCSGSFSCTSSHRKSDYPIVGGE